ncbi:hypothetical protein S40293_10175 [Stachybotrys chartarum IBT 40293]|nr:hypothetical protein S40293_10175 [Stachybotrys chartarum IBT 40293]
MRESSGAYFNLINDPEPVVRKIDDVPSPVMMSRVTGVEVDPEELGSFYWRQKLTSPVEFTDTVKELASPAASNGPAARAVDLLIEVGPHSAARRPNRADPFSSSYCASDRSHSQTPALFFI